MGAMTMEMMAWIPRTQGQHQTTSTHPHLCGQLLVGWIMGTVMTRTMAWTPSIPGQHQDDGYDDIR